jgi:hypothetical protein
LSYVLLIAWDVILKVNILLSNIFEGTANAVSGSTNQTTETENEDKPNHLNNVVKPATDFPG